ncbi:MAG: alanine racemase [Xanthomonadales bacterium]|nr:alanine racemase [Xanthomonadales bacterium]
MTRNTTASIDLSAVTHNMARVRTLAPGSLVAAVVKADAYGHGLAHVFPALESADILAVATVDEARSCRELRWKKRLLMLEGPANPDDLHEAMALGCEQVIHHASQIKLLRIHPHVAPGRYWLKLDTGMHRLGFPLEQACQAYAELTELAQSPPQVLMSHFACADDPANPMTDRQIREFDDAVNGLSGPVSLANSAAILNFPESHRDIVRPGIMLYGASPSPARSATELGIRPVMTLQCDLIAINHVGKGETVGYGAEQRCPENMDVGVAAIGYGDGYPRCMKPGSPVLVNGRRAGLIGPVSMDLITIDLRGHSEAKVGDRVTLWGEGLPVEEVATWADAIPYELVCGVTARVRTAVRS